MLITGLQKLTLLDFPGKTACTVFTHGCNFRCPFCHNAPLVTEKNDIFLSEEAFFSFLKKRQGILDGVCITGGEPTLQSDLKDFILKIKELGYAVKLDTNGYNPNVLENILSEGIVDYVAMDIKNSKAKYSLTAGTDIDIAKIEKSVELLKNSGVDYEFRTTVVKQLHTADDFKSIALWLQGESKYFLQQFRDGENVIFSGLSAPDENEMKAIADIVSIYMPNVKLRGI